MIGTRSLQQVRPTVFCCDCRFATIGHVYPLCTRSARQVLSLVSGEMEEVGTAHCENERRDPSGCGPDGRYWEEKP